MILIKLFFLSPLEHEIQQQEMKDSGLVFDKINSVILSFYKTGEINGQSFVRIPLRSNPNRLINMQKSLRSNQKIKCVFRRSPRKIYM